MSRQSSRLRRALRQIGATRLLGTFIFLLLAIAIAVHSWRLPLSGDAERALYDIRFTSTARHIGQDERIVLVTYNDQTLLQLQKRSPLDRKMLAEALAAIDGLGARAIGIDILLDQPQAEDPLLIDTFRRMKTPTFVGFTTSTENPDQMSFEQEQYLRGLLAQAAAGPVRPASIKAEPDLEDGVVRRWPRQTGALPPILSNSLADVHPEFRAYARSIDFRLPERHDEPLFANLPIELVAAAPDAVRDAIAGRYVLIGGDIKDQDDYDVPMSRQTGSWIKGIELHAHMLAQQIDGRVRAGIPAWLLWAAALLVVLAGALTALVEWRGWKLVLVIAGQVLLIAAAPFWLQSLHFDTLELPAFGWGVGWALAFAAAGTAARAVGSEQRRFAQSTLGKYLPADVAAEILKDPERLSLNGEKRPIFALFTDLEGFTKLSHAISPEQLSTLLNRYLETLSNVVLEHGGTIDKFVGDAIVAFWGAPIARPGDADRAVQAAMAMYQAGEAFRVSGGDDLPDLGVTRVGLHWGEAVVGNFGGVGRIQYTALGDAMNTAARLESANKALKTTSLVSKEAKDLATLDVFRPMGRIVLSGRATPVEVWEPMPAMDPQERQRLSLLWQEFDGGDMAALPRIEALAAANKDAALENFVYRVRLAGPGGHFVLGSK